MGVSAVDLIARLGSLGSDSGCNTAGCHSPTQPNHSEKPGPDDDLLQVAALDQGIYTFGIGTTNTASYSDAPLVISSAFFVTASSSGGCSVRIVEPLTRMRYLGNVKVAL